MNKRKKRARVSLTQTYLAIQDTGEVERLKLHLSGSPGEKQ
jgi:hypothetical protein